MIADIIRDTKHSLAISDAVAWIAAFAVVFLGSLLLFGRPFLQGREFLVYPFLLVLWVMSLAAMRCYQPAVERRATTDLFSGTALFLALAMVVGVRAKHPSDAFALFLISTFSLGFTLLFRTWLPWSIRRWVRGKQYETVLVLGHNGLSESGVARLRQRLRLATVQATFPHDGPGLGDRLEKLVAGSTAKEVLCVAADAPPHTLESVKEICERFHVGWQLVSSPEGAQELEFDSFSLDGVPLIGPKSFSITGFSRFYKAVFDLCLGSILLLLAAPVMLLIAIAIRLTSSGPAILAQERVGHLGTRFTMYKFRTMYENTNDERHREYVQNWMKNQAHTESNGKKIFKITNDDRITPFGRFLRRYSLDELPQILNVLKLEMSLVGPRPAMPYELEGYLPWHLRRLEGPPGLTGPWQVNGRNHLSFDEMVQLDVRYLQSWSPVQDLLLIARTVPAMFLGKGH